MATTSKCRGAIHGPRLRKQIMIERKRSISKVTPGHTGCPKEEVRFKLLALEINDNNSIIIAITLSYVPPIIIEK